MRETKITALYERLSVDDGQSDNEATQFKTKNYSWQSMQRHTDLPTLFTIQMMGNRDVFSIKQAM